VLTRQSCRTSAVAAQSARRTLLHTRAAEGCSYSGLRPCALAATLRGAAAALCTAHRMLPGHNRRWNAGPAVGAQQHTCTVELTWSTLAYKSPHQCMSGMRYIVVLCFLQANIARVLCHELLQHVIVSAAACRTRTAPRQQTRLLLNGH
jgi:hypothetical protein